jgi:hypothetical protein
MQAARHTTSHFNVAAPFDAFVWASMAFGILLVVLSTVVLTVNAFVARFEDAALGWVIRLSLVIVLAGMFSGGVMSQPTHSQLAQAKAGNGFPVSGAHTVGAPDGGPGVPVTNWSMEHGDLRVAHFLGFHGMQVLLLTWWVTKGRENWPAKRRTRLIFAIAASYSGVLILVMWQAFRAQSILKPDALTGNAWIAWLLITLACLAWALPLRTAGLQVNEA